MDPFNYSAFTNNLNFVGIASTDTPGSTGEVRVDPENQRAYLYTGARWAEIGDVPTYKNSYISFKLYFAIHIEGRKRIEGNNHYRLLLNSPFNGSCGIRFTAPNDLMMLQQMRIWNFEKDYIVQLKNEDTGKIFIDTYAAFVLDPSDIYTI